jgi:sterol desaturase/sphingolipid hydroxylase (fatty acid hydroxylase superfamily)
MQSLWENVYDNHRWMLENPLSPSVIIFFAYPLCALPFVLLDHLRSVKDRKIQPGKYATRQQIFSAIYDYLMCEVLVYVPLTALSVMFADKGAMATVVRRDLPGITEFLYDVLRIYLFMDLLFYVTHYALHTKFLYKHVHAKHHLHRSPFAFATQSHHWFESFLMGLVTTIPIYLFSRHVFTQWATLVLSLMHGVLVHSGYDSGIEKLTNGWIIMEPSHDLHHKRVVGNYGAYTSLYDRMFGTRLRGTGA